MRTLTSCAPAHRIEGGKDAVSDDMTETWVQYTHLEEFLAEPEPPARALVATGEPWQVAGHYCAAVDLDPALRKR
jgi:hypothetical protein